MADKDDKSATSGETATVVTPAQERAAAIVGTFRDKLRNTAFSRDTEAWNVLHAALPDLIELIAGEISA